MGIGDLQPLLDAGVNVALGTDGPGSNNDMDMKAVIRAAPLLQKYHTRNAEALPGDLPLRLATANGARAMGFPESGVLAPGRAADLVLFDLDQPHLYPRHNLVANLVHSADRDGEFLTLDVHRIMAEAERHARRMVGQEMKIVREYKG
jgi:5-methylthioadenosine/S-adenosylhomocysteine deaminase